jgi:hypothetical protein
LTTYHLRDSGADIFVENEEELDDIIMNAGSKRFDQGGLRQPGFMILLASFEGYLMVYKDTKLAWTTKLTTPPIFLYKATF